MLCGEGINMEVSKTYNSGLTILITALLGLITLFTILMSRKGKRTWYAIALTALGIGIILFSVIMYGGQPLYYTGILFVFFGVWLNGSLPWLVRSVRNVSFMGRRDLVS
jgi:Na+/melibiose symporter-like transporter